MKTVKSIVLVTVFLFLIYLVGYRVAAQPMLGVAVEHNGRELFVPRHRVSCDDLLESCTVRLDQRITIDLTKNMSSLPGNCGAFSGAAAGPVYAGQYQCSAYARSYWRNEASPRRIVLLKGIELSAAQTARMQVESWIVAIAMGDGPPFQLFLTSLSSLLGLQVAHTLFKLQRGWGTRKPMALLGASTAGLLVALFGWIPLFIVIEIWGLGPLY